MPYFPDSFAADVYSALTTFNLNTIQRAQGDLPLVLCSIGWCSPVAGADLPMSQRAVYTEPQTGFDSKNRLQSGLPDATGGQTAGQGCHGSWS